VIANVTPVRLRIEQLCTLEYVRILSKHQQSCLRALLQDATLLRSGFTPMRYLYFQSKTVHKAMEDQWNLSIQYKPQKFLLTAELNIDIVHNNDCGNVTSVQGKVDEFIRLHQHESVIAFTDGAVTENGKGSSACILIPLEVGVSVVKASQVHSVMTCSLEAEMAAIASAMERAVEYYTHTELRKQSEKLFILTDCKAALYCIARRTAMRHFHVTMSRIRFSARF